MLSKVWGCCVYIWESVESFSRLNWVKVGWCLLLLTDHELCFHTYIQSISLHMCLFFFFTTWHSARRAGVFPHDEQQRGRKWCCESARNGNTTQRRVSGCFSETDRAIGRSGANKKEKLCEWMRASGGRKREGWERCVCVYSCYTHVRTSLASGHHSVLLKHSFQRPPSFSLFSTINCLYF